MPKGVTWIKEKVTGFMPENNTIQLESGNTLQYDYLVVAAGIQLNWHEIKGLKETLGKNNVCSNYSFEHAPYTFECIKNFRGGKAIFHSPDTPVKCGGAPHKIMYLAADYFRKHGVLDKADIQYWSGGTRLFAVPKYEKTLLKVCERANIGLNFKVKLTEVDGPNKKAKFVGIGESNKNREYIVDFDMLHVTPPQSAPSLYKVEFTHQYRRLGRCWDKHTLQHVRYPNIFSLGDSSGLPTSKTGAAIRKQAPVLVENLLAASNDKNLTASYNGYTSCPVVTGYGKLVLAKLIMMANHRRHFRLTRVKKGGVCTS